MKIFARFARICNIIKLFHPKMAAKIGGKKNFALRATITQFIIHNKISLLNQTSRKFGCILLCIIKFTDVNYVIRPAKT